MKFAKTFCKPNSVLSVVPAGLPVKLQYNQNGVLMSFKIGFTRDLAPDYVEPGLKFDHDELLKKIKGFVPNMISTRGGTTWIYGIFYSDVVPMTEGPIPKALYQTYIDDLLKGGKYEFYAGYVKSLAVSLTGSLIIRNFLTSVGFNLLPQVIVPTSVQEETFNMLMNPNTYPFNRQFVAGYMIFEDLNCRYVADNLMQIKVTNKPELFVDADGYWKAEVVSESKETYTFNYSSIVRNDVAKGSIILVESDTYNNALKIVATRTKAGAQIVPKNAPESVKCPICGKVNKVGVDDAPLQCDDPHCLSHMYSDVVKLLRTLKLPELSQEDYVNKVASGDITCLTDVLALPEYHDNKVVCSLSQAISAVVPASVVPNSELIERFANKCNNSPETVMYYLDNPLRIETDLDIVDPIAKRFAAWLQDPTNILTVKAILDIVEIQARSKKFEGYPIFRSMSFIITGRFKRGDYHEIASILESYDAKVSPAFEPGEPLPNAVIQGSLNEGVSGAVIQKARVHNIPILLEDDFFQQYEIDDDLAKNLL